MRCPTDPSMTAKGFILGVSVPGAAAALMADILFALVFLLRSIGGLCVQETKRCPGNSWKELKHWNVWNVATELAVRGGTFLKS